MGNRCSSSLHQDSFTACIVVACVAAAFSVLLLLLLMMMMVAARPWTSCIFHDFGGKEWCSLPCWDVHHSTLV